jgi:hypothetical protein
MGRTEELLDRKQLLCHHRQLRTDIRELWLHFLQKTEALDGDTLRGKGTHSPGRQGRGAWLLRAPTCAQVGRCGAKARSQNPQITAPGCVVLEPECPGGRSLKLRNLHQIPFRQVFWNPSNTGPHTSCPAPSFHCPDESCEVECLQEAEFSRYTAKLCPPHHVTWPKLWTTVDALLPVAEEPTFCSLSNSYLIIWVQVAGGWQGLELSPPPAPALHRQNEALAYKQNLHFFPETSCGCERF